MVGVRPATHPPGTRAAAVEGCGAHSDEGSQVEPVWSSDWGLAAQAAPEYEADQRINW